MSIRVSDTDRPDTWQVQGRGELQLAVLVEIMRREGFEMTVGKPKVVTRTVGGRLHEPTERITIDVPEDFVGATTQLLGERKARMVNMANHGTGWVRIDYIVAARGLIGFRTEFLTETRGTGLMGSVFEGYTPWLGELGARRSGSIVADRRGAVTAYAVAALQDRTSLFVTPGDEVYEGMVIGENPRLDDMNVNTCREKKQTNVRAAASDDTVRLTPPRILSLEQALEFIADDECVEVTPHFLRLRKVVPRGRGTRPQQETPPAQPVLKDPHSSYAGRTGACHAHQHDTARQPQGDTVSVRWRRGRLCIHTAP